MSKQADTYKLEYNGSIIECDRVTNVLGGTKGSAGLAEWNAKEERAGILRILGKHSKIEDAIAEIDARLIQNDDGKMVPWYFADELRDTAADNGNTVHHMVHRDATGEPLPATDVITPVAEQKFGHFLALKKATGFKYVESEKRVFSPELGVAGTLDLFVEWSNEEWLMDTKTGRLKRDAATQSITYAVLRAQTKAIEDGDVATLTEIQRAHREGRVPNIKWPRIGVLHLEEDGAEIYEIDPTLFVPLFRNFLFRLQAFRDDQTMRPFKRVWPLKDGKESKYLRAS